jgi:multidrug efflux system membrane fusion protein
MNRPDFPKRRWWTAAGVLAAAAAASAVITGFDASKARASDAPAAPQAIPVSVAAVGESDITAWDEFSGRLEAVERVDLRARVAGAVQSVHFREGALVRKGDLLFTIDPAPYAAEAERAEAQAAAAQARLAHAQSELARARRLWEESAIAQREVEERVNAEREAGANLRATQAQLQGARLNLGYTQVRAPVAGRIGKLEVTPGNLVILRALKDMPGGSSARALIERIPVQMGTAAMSDTPYHGKLQLIDNQVDAKSGTIRVRAAFDNQDGTLIPGQFARVRMGQARTNRAVLVSERAIGTDQEKKFVLVVGAGNKAEYREVTLGAPAAGLRVVQSGLKAGERIVVNGLQRVRPGAVVQPELVAMDARS